MTRVRIENIAHLVTVDPTDQILRNATVLIDDGLITAITTAGRSTSRPMARSTALSTRLREPIFPQRV